MKVLILGGGEISAEIVKALKTQGEDVVVVDRYDDPPASKYAKSITIDMTNEQDLTSLLEEESPDFVYVDIEAINVDSLLKYENNGGTVVPSASAIQICMNRGHLRNLAISLGINTPKTFLIDSYHDFETICLNEFDNQKVVLKPNMSSSGKGQVIIPENRDKRVLLDAWTEMERNTRVGNRGAVLEEFINFDYEISVIAFKNTENKIRYYPPIVHTQENGDLRTAKFSSKIHPFLRRIEDIINKIINNINQGSRCDGRGIYGFEFFVSGSKLYFSEVSPRPHDTGFLTVNSTNIDQFKNHVLSSTGYLCDTIVCDEASCIQTINFDKHSDTPPKLTRESFDNIKSKGGNLIWFDKPTGYPGRRVGIIQSRGPIDVKIDFEDEARVSTTLWDFLDEIENIIKIDDIKFDIFESFEVVLDKVKLEIYHSSVDGSVIFQLGNLDKSLRYWFTFGSCGPALEIEPYENDVELTSREFLDLLRDICGDKS